VFVVFLYCILTRCCLSDFQLLHNEANTEAIDEEWLPIINECTSVCLRGDSHKDCSICYVLVIQLNHCATASCDVGGCEVCGRIVALVSLHYAECRHQLALSCRCREYLASSQTSKPVSTVFLDVGMMLVDGVRRYLQSVIPTLAAHNADEDDDDNSDVNDDDIHGDEDYDSDSSNSSIMMPSFSSSDPSFQPPSNKPSDSTLPEGGAFGFAPELPGLSGRGINSATAAPVPSFDIVGQPAKPVPRSPRVPKVIQIADPRVCISSEVPAGTVGHGAVLHSVPVTGTFRPRGRMHYGTKSQLRKFASLWQNYTERAKSDALHVPSNPPTEGLILDDCRGVSFIFRRT